MILYDDGLFAELGESRTLVIYGKKSSGKTLLAHELAHHYLEHGYYLISQSESVWNDDPATVKMDALGKLHAFIIIDEGGLYFRSQDSARAVSSFAAKLDTFVIFAGRKVPHVDLCDLTCQVWFNAFKWFWLPLKIWRYDVVSGNKTYSGYFFQTAWWDYYGIYNTLDPGDDPIWIVRQMEEWTKAYFKLWNRTYSLSTVENFGGSSQQEVANELATNIQALARASQTVSRHKKKW